jgi:type I restriction-modification system DNA methylase subunit
MPPPLQSVAVSGAGGSCDNIEYDYIMALIARYSAQVPGKQRMSREQLIGLIQSDAKFMDERDDIAAYINTLKAGEGLSEKDIREGYQRFKAEKNAQELAAIAGRHGLTAAALQGFVDGILQRMIFDGEQLTDGRRVPLAIWYANNPDDVADFEKQMRRKVHYVIKPDHLWASIANLARTQNGELLNTLQAAFKYIETESFQSTFQGLFSEINLASDKLGKKYEERNAKLGTIIQKIAEGLTQFSTDADTLGDAYEYLIGQFAAGSGKKAGEFYTPQQISSILSGIVTLDSQEPKTGKKAKLDSVLDFACGSG